MIQFEFNEVTTVIALLIIFEINWISYQLRKLIRDGLTWFIVCRGIILQNLINQIKSHEKFQKLN